MDPILLFALAGWMPIVTLLLWRAPRLRKWTAGTSLVFLASVAALFYVEQPLARQVLFTLEGLALVALVGRTIVDVIGPWFGVRAPTIMRDFLVVMASGLFVLFQLHQAGVEIAALITTSAVLSVTLGIALQDTLGNLLGGLSLQLDDSLNVGDWIRHDGVFGRVTSMSWRNTSFHTNNGETIVLPNSLLVKSKFVVLGRQVRGGKAWRRVINLTIDDEVPPSRVIDLMERTLRECEIVHLLQEPRPSVVLAELELGFARYQIRYWLDDFMHDDTTDSHVRNHLYFALRRADIGIVPPSTHVEYEQRSNRRLTAIDGADRATVEALLGDMALFKPLLPEERAELAAHIRVAPFTKTDTITKQGAEAHWLYIIADGEAEVVWQSPDGSKHSVAELGPRDFFGEMGLMTGAPRTATIVAKTDVVCWRIDKQAFLTVIQRRPEMAEALSKTLAERRNELDELRARHSSTAPPKHDDHDLLDRIRAFFSLES